MGDWLCARSCVQVRVQIRCTCLQLWSAEWLSAGALSDMHTTRNENVAAAAGEMAMRTCRVAGGAAGRAVGAITAGGAREMSAATAGFAACGAGTGSVEIAKAQLQVGAVICNGLPSA